MLAESPPPPLRCQFDVPQPNRRPDLSNLNLEDEDDPHSCLPPPYPPQAPPGSLVTFDITSKFRDAAQSMRPFPLVFFFPLPFPTSLVN